MEVAFHSYPRLGEGDLDTMEQHDWRQFDGIIMAPGNPARLNSISRIAEEENKTIVYVATDAARTHRLASIAVESAVSGGIAAELLGQIIRENRPVVAITGRPENQDHAEKLRGLLPAWRFLSPHLRLLPAIESDQSPEDAHRSALELLERNPDLGGIYINTANSLPVMPSARRERPSWPSSGHCHRPIPEMEHLIEAGHVFA